MRSLRFFSMQLLLIFPLGAMEPKKEVLTQITADNCNDSAIFAALNEKVSRLFDEAEKSGDIVPGKYRNLNRDNAKMNLSWFKSRVTSGLLLMHIKPIDSASCSFGLVTPKGVHNLEGYPGWADVIFKNDISSTLKNKLLQQLEAKEMNFPERGDIYMSIVKYYAITKINNQKISMAAVEGDRPIRDVYLEGK